ncbi:hypothetical protein Plec18167_002773 [Paecilomyces lecythidis]|uniref:J domain-containing protein n=1 Tax=Paecilomyces lecythidis TaxID=3004212 RepID=A0ABR3Y636_9EURO
MVKADVRRDYYADLGLTPSADTDEIKKQFRKLALKYHPDRNPGREAEFNAKFQAIQAAHEILIDPQLRLKYDTDRLRAGYGRTYSAAKATPTKKPTTPKPTSQPYAPPPPPPTSRAQASRPSHAQRQSYQAHPSASAQSFARYARAAQQQPWEKMRDEPQTRADAFRGFQEMKNSATPGWANFDPRTGKSYPAPRGTPTGTPSGQSARPTSAYEYFKTAYGKQPPPTQPATGPSRTQSTRKKQGFAPGTPGGDEPPATNTSAYTSAPRPERAFYEAAPAPTAKKTAPPEEFTIPGFERLSTRYATSGGERTYFSSSGLGRSSTVRESPSSPRPHSRTNPPSPAHTKSGRHRSASPQLKNRDRAFSSSTTSSDLDEDDDEDDEDQPTFKPRAVPKSRLRPNHKFSDFYRNSGAGENPSIWPVDYDSPDHLHLPGRFDRPRPRSHHGYMDDHTDSYYEGHASDSTAFQNGFQASATTPETHNAHRPETRETHSGPDAVGGSKEPFNKYDAAPKPSNLSWSRQWGFSSPKFARQGTRKQPPYWAYPSSVMIPAISPKRVKMSNYGNQTALSAATIQASLNRLHYPSDFSKSRNPGRNADPFHSFQGSTTSKAAMNGQSKSQESLHTTFSADHWRNTFEGAADFFTPSAKDAATRGRASPGRGRTGRSTTSSQSMTGSSSQGTSRAPSTSKQAPTPFAEAKFSADIWAEQLKNAAWTIPQPESTQAQANTRRARSPRKQTRPAAKSQPTVSTEADEERATLNPEKTDAASEVASRDGEAMDIDEDIPAKSAAPVNGHRPGEPRLVSVEPNRPEWRSGAREDKAHTTAASSEANKTGQTQPTSEPRSNETNGQPNLFNFNGLNNVTPLAATNNVGINDLNDIFTTLPFESRANDQSDARSGRPRDLQCPNPPRRPTRPAFAAASAGSQQMVLPKQAWDRYVAEMTAYMREWNTFNRRMLRHFNARQDSVETGLSPQWISAFGDSTRLTVDDEGGKDSDVDDEEDTLIPGTARGGYSAYLRGIKEDFKVREHWNVAWELHLECVQELGELRNWIKTGGKVVA